MNIRLTEQRNTSNSAVVVNVASEFYSLKLSCANVRTTPTVHAAEVPMESAAGAVSIGGTMLDFVFRLNCDANPLKTILTDSAGNICMNHHFEVK